MMCISIPALVETIEVPGRAEVLVDGRLLKVVLAVDDIRPGDWVLIHAGIAVQSIDASTAEEIRAFLNAGQVSQ
jgi:hydrogenase expression/formation protein HypC